MSVGRAAELAARHAAELRGIDPALSDRFAATLETLEGRLDAARMDAWARIAVDLAHRAPGAASALMAATPEVPALLEPPELELWALLGARLCRGSWKSERLASRFFAVGPEILGTLRVGTLERLVDVVERLARRSDEIAALCLRDAPSRLAELGERDRGPFLGVVRAVCEHAWTDTHRCIEQGPERLASVHPGLRGEVCDLATSVARETGTETLGLFSATCEALGELAPEDQSELLTFARRLAPHGGRAAIESIRSAPGILRRLGRPQARRWRDAGLDLITRKHAPETAERYFRLESAHAEELLGELGAGVELASVGNLLRLYAKALAGGRPLVQPREALVARGLGWTTGASATTDGVCIFLPSRIDLFGDRDSNFQVYKVHTAHQAGRLEFGSFGYRFGVDGTHLPSTVQAREQRRPGAPAAAVPIQRLFDLFADRRLFSELFALVEDARVDACIGTEYPGIRAWLRRVQQLEAEGRPEPRLLPLRQAFVENLVRASLGRASSIRWPRALAPQIERAVAILRIVERIGATVQDAAESSAALYDMAIAIPNVPAHRVPGDWGGLDEDAVACALDAPDAGPDVLAELPEGDELVYESPGVSGYRGELKPELVQLLEEMSELERSGDVDAQLKREQLEALLASSAEIEPGEDPDAVAGDRDGLLSRLELEAARRAHGDAERLADDADGGETPEIQWFRYDEWDFRAGDYRPDWCHVGERAGTEGELAFYDETLRRHHGLVVETRRQFERMRPESFRRLRRLEDGEEIDLDHAIEFRADKRAGAGPQARFYARRNKVRRDVAVAFLLDMSGSTGERIPRPSRDERRIIDLERESAVLVVEALEAIGDAYAIYGFSGDGRENVEIHVIKDLDEPLDDRVRRRIDGIEPVRATRMGAALRHAARKLLDHEARVKILILVSDGRPEDEGYGRERGENEYAVHDTRRALLEARRQRITPFLITVDTAGQDYLRHMCDDLGYELVADVESLPRRLPTLYRHLAAE